MANGGSGWRSPTLPDFSRRRGKSSPNDRNVGAAATRLAQEVRALQADDDGLGAIVIGLPRRLSGEPNDQTARVQKLAQLLAAHVDVPITLQDERLTSHEADELLAERERDWRKRKRPARRDGRRPDPPGLSRPPAPMKKFATFVVLLILVGAGAAAWWFYAGVDRPFKGYDAPEVFVEIPQGAGSVAIAKRLADAGVVRDVNSFRLALWLSGRRPPAAGRRVPVRPARHAAAGRRQDRARRGLRPADHVSRRADHQADGGGLRGEGLRAGEGVHRRGEERRARRAIDPDARDLEGYLFPDTYKLPRALDRAAARRAHGAGAS